MGKKKKRKEEKKPASYQVELVGMILILIAIIGICEFGIVGTFFKGFAAFLIGEWYILLFLFLLIIGAYMIVKRSKPNYFTSKLIGLYIMLMAVLVLLHLPYGDYEGFNIIVKTFENICSFIKNPESRLYGGGLIGGALFTIFTLLLDKEGTKVVSIFLLIIGFIMFSGK